MGKFYGKIGYVRSEETAPGVWEEIVEERSYRGDVIKHITRWENNSSGINDNLNVNNEISIVSDPFAYQHLSEIRYIEYMGAKWKVNTVTVQHPRLNLSIGGLYNGQSN